MYIHYTVQVGLPVITTKVNIHISAIKTDNLILRIKSGHLLSWQMGKHYWHSTGHQLKHFLSSSGDQKLHEIVGKTIMGKLHKDLNDVVKCTL